VALKLPDFPWDSLAPYAATARAHHDGLVDLSVGSPVDGTAAVVRKALAGAADAHSYPLTSGTAALREAIVDWFARRRGVDDLTVANVLPTIGSKEFIAGLPLWLGLGPDDVVVQPALAYPTYAVGAALVGARVVSTDDPAQWPENTKLAWLNSPGNPDGRVLTIDELRSAVARARELDAIVVSDECYAELGWGDEWATTATPSILDPRVIHGQRDHVLAVYSLSKQSDLAGYRAAFAAGCSDIIGEVLAVRKNLGLALPDPIQVAMIAALGDEAHVVEQKAAYGSRRELLLPALRAAGFTIDDSEGGLYLWATRGEDCWATVAALAELGILVAPGAYYGVSGAQHVRVALTATDEAISAAVERLASISN
jgi:succinyldiaminopimelate transaminase